MPQILLHTERTFCFFLSEHFKCVVALPSELPCFLERNKLFILLRMWLKGCWGRSLVIKASSLFLRCYEVRSLFYHMLPAIMFFLKIGQKSINSADHGLKPL
jgi:hypothetical protein